MFETYGTSLLFVLQCGRPWLIMGRLWDIWDKALSTGCSVMGRKRAIWAMDGLTKPSSVSGVLLFVDADGDSSQSPNIAKLKNPHKMDLEGQLW